MTSVSIKRPIKMIGVPWDEHSSFSRGPAAAPPEIRKAFLCESTNTWSEIGLNINDPSVLIDQGDLDLSGKDDPLIKIERGIAAAIKNRSAVESAGYSRGGYCGA